MKKLLLATIIGIALLFTIGFAQMEERPEPGQKYPIDLFSFIPWMSGGSARIIAMGGAGTALANDASSVEYNPAGLAYVKNFNLSVLVLGEVNKEVTGYENDNPVYEYKFNFVPLYAAVVISNLGAAYKKPFIPPITVQRFDEGYWTSYAPDTYPMKFDFYSDVTDTSKLNTISAGLGQKLGPIALGANLTYISGEDQERLMEFGLEVEDLFLEVNTKTIQIKQSLLMTPNFIPMTGQRSMDIHWMWEQY